MTHDEIETATDAVESCVKRRWVSLFYNREQLRELATCAISAYLGAHLRSVDTAKMRISDVVQRDAPVLGVAGEHLQPMVAELRASEHRGAPILQGRIEGAGEPFLAPRVDDGRPKRLPPPRKARSKVISTKLLAPPKKRQAKAGKKR